MLRDGLFGVGLACRRVAPTRIEEVMTLRSCILKTMEFCSVLMIEEGCVGKNELKSRRSYILDEE